jgi:hypothetical protein
LKVAAKRGDSGKTVKPLFTASASAVNVGLFMAVSKIDQTASREFHIPVIING